MAERRLNWLQFTIPGVSLLLIAMLWFDLGDTQSTEAWWGTSILLLLILSWLLFGHKSFKDRTTPDQKSTELSGWVFFTLLAIATLLLCAISPQMALIQAIAYPYVWMRSGKTWQILVMNLIIAVAVMVGFAWQGSWEIQMILAGLSAGGGSVLFSLFMGSWITSIIDQVEQRTLIQARLDQVSGELAEAQRQAGASAERERFSHEIHDTLTQTLTAVVMLAERAGDELDKDAAVARSTIELAEKTARQALAETRSLIAEGKGLELEADTSFSDSLHRLCQNFGEETGVTMTITLTPEADELDRADQVVLLRCLQETLANVRKHAHASQARVELAVDDESGIVTLTVSDDGVGFAEGVDEATERGFGLSGIRSRLALSSGRLTIEPGSTKDGGVVVTVTLPRQVHE